MELNNIKLNEKYTLLIENTWGILVSRKVRINDISEVEAYCKYGAKNLKIIYTEKNKRKKYGVKFTDNKVAIIDGWIDIKGVANDSNVSELESFKEGLFDNIIEINKLKPVLRYN